LAQELSYPETTDNGNNDPQFTAYCASYILCKKYGVDTQGYNFDNVSVVFNGMEPQEIKAELSLIRDTVSRIAERMAKHLDAAQKAAKSQEAR
jgi:hypothetical protein